MVFNNLNLSIGGEKKKGGQFILIFLFVFRTSEDDDDYELSDEQIDKLLIVTQTATSTPGPMSTRHTKHEGYDRTGDWTTRVKMTQELEQAISDGLRIYEDDLQTDQAS